MRMRGRTKGLMFGLVWLACLFSSSCADSLSDAAASGDVDRIQALLTRGEDPNEADARGWTPLHYAAKGRHERAVALLLAHGAAPDAGGHLTPLHLAAGHGSVGSVCLLLDRGADANARVPSYGAPLNVVVGIGEAWKCEVEAIVTSLLSSGADPNLPDGYGKTALMGAALMALDEVAEHLLEAGASVDVKDRQGRTCLHYAVMGGRISIVQLLLAHGESPNAADENGDMALHLAAEAGNHAMVCWLLEAGANSGARNARRLTPLDLAVQEGHSDVAESIRRQRGGERPAAGLSLPRSRPARDSAGSRAGP